MHILSHNLAKHHLSNDFCIMLSTSSCSCEAGLFLIWCILLEGNGWSFEGVECYLLDVKASLVMNFVVYYAEHIIMFIYCVTLCMHASYICAKLLMFLLLNLHIFTMFHSEMSFYHLVCS